MAACQAVLGFDGVTGFEDVEAVVRVILHQGFERLDDVLLGPVVMLPAHKGAAAATAYQYPALDQRRQRFTQGIARHAKLGGELTFSGQFHARFQLLFFNQRLARERQSRRTGVWGITIMGSSKVLRHSLQGGDHPDHAGEYQAVFHGKTEQGRTLPTSPTAAQAMAMDCGEIIFPVTLPAVVFAATSSTSETPICWSRRRLQGGEQGVRRGIWNRSGTLLASRGTAREEGEGVPV